MTYFLSIYLIYKMLFSSLKAILTLSKTTLASSPREFPMNHVVQEPAFHHHVSINSIFHLHFWHIAHNIFQFLRKNYNFFVSGMHNYCLHHSKWHWKKKTLKIKLHHWEFAHVAQKSDVIALILLHFCHNCSE